MSFIVWLRERCSMLSLRQKVFLVNPPLHQNLAHNPSLHLFALIVVLPTVWSLSDGTIRKPASLAKLGSVRLAKSGITKMLMLRDNNGGEGAGPFSP